MTRTIALRLVLAHAVAAVAFGALAGACGGSSSDTGPAAVACPNLGELTCPSPPPSFKTQVQPIIESRCYGCHGPGGVEVASTNLTSYDQIVQKRGDILAQITSCKMPQADAGQLTVEELTTFVEWLGECSAPNN
jgi:hypothetical protein